MTDSDENSPSLPIHQDSDLDFDRRSRLADNIAYLVVQEYRRREQSNPGSMVDDNTLPQQQP